MKKILSVPLCLVGMFLAVGSNAEGEERKSTQLALRAQAQGMDASALAQVRPGEGRDSRSVLERVRRNSYSRPRDCAPNAGFACVQDSHDRLRASEVRQFRINDDRTHTPTFDREVTIEVKLPERGDGEFELRDRASGMRVSARMLRSSTQLAASLDGYLVYRADGATAPSVVHRPSELGVEDYVLFDEPPSSGELRYEINLHEGVMGLRTVAGSVELLNAEGIPVLRIQPPVAWLADGREEVLRSRLERCAADKNPAPPLGRPVVPPGARSCILVISLPLNRAVYPLVVDPVWSSASTTKCTARYRSPAITVPKINGQDGVEAVLLTGGTTTSSYTCAELFLSSDSGTYGFAATSKMNAPHTQHTVVLVPINGVPHVLVIGGADVESGTISTVVEGWNTVTGEWTPLSGAGSLAQLIEPRKDHTATVLSDGRVLVAGGGNYAAGGDTLLQSWTIYNPATNSWTTTTDDETLGLRSQHSASLLKVSGGDRVLVLGGLKQLPWSSDALATSGAMFDPSANSGFGGWSTVAHPVLGGVAIALGGHGTVTLPDGRVLLAGGYTDWIPNHVLATGYLYDGAWTPTSNVAAAGYDGSVVLLPNGYGAIAGGATTSGVSIAGLQAYDPVANQWNWVGSATGLSGRSLAAIATFGSRNNGVGSRVFVGLGIAQRAPLPDGTQGAPLSDGRMLTLNSPGEICANNTDCLGGLCVGSGPKTCGPVACQSSGATGCLPGQEPTVGTPTADVATDLYDQLHTLWSGAGNTTPIQGTQVGSTSTVSAIAASVFDPNRVGAIHGRVLSASGQALSGIRVRVLTKANNEQSVSYGVTFTRASGEFDFVVNGGVSVTLVFEENLTAPNFLPAERDVMVPPLGRVAVPDVVLTLKSGSSTAVTLDGTWQFVTGPTVGFGTNARTPRVIFPATTSATVTPLSGSPSTITSINMRMTEYTDSVDAKKMPGALPPTSAFTYAADFSIDEAQAFDKVTFTGGDPIAYVDDFIGMNVATTAPLGALDFASGAWKSSPSGRVVKLLSIANNQVNLDVTGDGVADGDINMDGVIDSKDIDEQRLLALMYPSGLPKIVWRTTLPHLSAWDINWGVAPPPGAANCSGCEPQTPAHEPDSCETDGSIIECENQALGQRFPVAGTPYFLVYRSDRQLGRGSGIRVQVVAATLPSTVVGATVNIDVAGRRYTKHYAKADLSTNLFYEFHWDGKDAFGRTIFGDELASIAVGWEYTPVYGATREFGYNAGAAITSNSARDVLTYWKWSSARVQHWDARGAGLGGWDLNVHHVYDPRNRTVYLGDGKRIVSEPFARTTARAAGGNARDCNKTGNVATDGLGFMTSIAVAPNGRTFYVEQACSPRLNYFDADGVIHPVSIGVLTYPHAVSVAPDGQVYVLNGLRAGVPFKFYRLSEALNSATELTSGVTFGDHAELFAAADSSVYSVDLTGGNYRLLRITPSGTVQIVLGSGSARSTLNVQPTHAVVDLQGTVYFTNNVGVVYRMLPGGDPQRIIGGCSVNCQTSDGILGTSYTGPAFDKLAVALDGTLYVSAFTSTGISYQRRVWRLDADGKIRIHVGLPMGGTYAYAPLVNGEPAGGSTINSLVAMTVAPDGTFYYADDDSVGGGNKPVIRPVQLPLPASSYTASGNSVIYTIASRDGAELYGFSMRGQHLETRDARTGAVVRTLEYDGQGRVTYVNDKAVDTGVTKRTQIRYAQGAATITGPYNHQTKLTLDTTSQYATTIKDPTDRGLTLEYFASGLLSKLTDANNRVHSFQYDPYGRLFSDAGPTGGAKYLFATYASGKVTTRVMTPEGRVTLFDVEPMSGGQQRTVTDVATGLKATWRRLQSGINFQTRADGSMVEWIEGPDPRFLMQAPIKKSYTKRLTVSSSPTGVLSYVRTQSSVAQCAPDVANPCSGTPTSCSVDNITQLRTRTDTIVANNATYTVAYDKCAASLPAETITTPMLRTRTLSFDALGRIQTINVPGVAPVTLNYGPDGSASEVRHGSGPLERVLSMSYHTTATGGENGQLKDTSINFGAPIASTYASYDAAARPLAVTLPGIGRSVYVTYDFAGNLSTLDPPGTTAMQHRFGYDGADRFASYTPPSISGTEMTTQTPYNRDGQPWMILRPDGDYVIYGYDAGRLTSISHAVRSVGYTYDTKGRVSTVKASDGQILTYNYTNTGALVRSVVWTGPVGGTSGYAVSFDYNSDFRVTKEIAGNVRAEYGYDSDGLITSIVLKNNASGATLPNGTMILSYDPDNGAAQFIGDSTGRRRNGQLYQTTVGSVTDTRTYNAFGELRRYAAGTYVDYTLDASGYERDKLGRIVRRTETYPAARTWDYTYFDAGWLKDVKDGGMTNESYTYDANGNRSTATNTLNSESGVSSTAVDAQDRLNTYSTLGNTKTFTYTGSGERLTRTDSSGTTTYTYDVFGNLLRAVLPSGTIDYLVDGLGRRIGKKVNGTLRQQWLYGSQLRPVLELDGGNNLVARFIYATQANVPDLIVTYTSGIPTTIHRVLTDHVGSVRAIVPATAGTPVQIFDYDSFGNVISASPAYPALTGTPSALQTFGFAGGMYDPHSKLVRFGARDYEPETGGWLAKDPIGFKSGDSNLYGYAFADPISFIDVGGLAPKDKLFGLPKKFWKWFHRRGKEPGDPDLCKKEAEDLHDEWKKLGKPGPDNKSPWNDLTDDLLDLIIPFVPPIILDPCLRDPSRCHNEV